MTVADLMHHNFDEIFIALDPVKREAMMRNAYREDLRYLNDGEWFLRVPTGWTSSSSPFDRVLVGTRA